MTGLLGATVAYKLTEQDATTINHRRQMARRYGWSGNVTGQLIHAGNQVSPGDVFPAVVVRVWPTSGLVNLQVLLDGTDTLWSTSVHEGDGSAYGEWFELELVEELDPVVDDDDASSAPDELPTPEPTPQPSQVLREDGSDPTVTAPDGTPIAAAAGRPMTDEEIVQAGGSLEDEGQSA